MGLTEGFSLSAVRMNALAIETKRLTIIKVLLIIIDLTFIHQRPKAIAMIWSIIGSTALAALAAVPYVSDHGNDARRFYLFWSIPAAINCIVAFLFLPETYFKRPVVAFDGRHIVQSGSERFVIYDDFDEDFAEKDLPNAPKRSGWMKFVDRFRIPRASCSSWKAMGRCYLQVLGCLLNPLIFWVYLLNAVTFGGMMFIGETYAMNLTSLPYKLPTHLLVLVNVACAIGSILAWPAQGPLVCRILKYLSRRNKGVCEAEQYLIAFVLPVIAGTASVVLYGLTIHYNWHYTLVYVAYGLNGFNFVGLSIANTLFVTAAFPRWAAPALVVVGGASYITSFGLSFVLIPWIKTQGYMNVGLSLAAAQAGLGFVVVPIAFWGKSARQYIHARWGVWEDGALRPQ